MSSVCANAHVSIARYRHRDILRGGAQRVCEQLAAARRQLQAEHQEHRAHGLCAGLRGRRRHGRHQHLRGG